MEREGGVEICSPPRQICLSESDRIRSCRWQAGSQPTAPQASPDPSPRADIPGWPSLHVRWNAGRDSPFQQRVVIVGPDEPSQQLGRRENDIKMASRWSLQRIFPPVVVGKFLNMTDRPESAGKFCNSLYFERMKCFFCRTRTGSHGSLIKMFFYFPPHKTGFPPKNTGFFSYPFLSKKFLIHFSILASPFFSRIFSISPPGIPPKSMLSQSSL